MSDSQPTSLEERLAALEARLRPLEDAEAIRNLKARYAALCDDNYNPDGIAALFTEDAVWEAQDHGRFVGRDAIRDFFKTASKTYTFAIHYSLNAEINIDGDTAQAQWYLFMPCTLGANDQAMWRGGIDYETYVRVDGVWMFKAKSTASLFSTPFDVGWAKQQFT